MIEYNAEQILIVHRWEQMGLSQVPNTAPKDAPNGPNAFMDTHNLVEVIIDKNEESDAGIVNLHYDPTIQLFTRWGAPTNQQDLPI